MSDVTDKIRENINYSGIFLERALFDILRKGVPHYNTAREVPYSVDSAGKIVNGTADIVTAGLAEHCDDMILCFVLEAKRANPNMKHWVFEAHGDEHAPTNKIPIYIQGEALPEIKEAHYGELDYHSRISLERAIHVLEFDEGSGKTNLQRDKAFGAIRQVNEAYAGLAAGPATALELKKSNAKPGTKVAYIPVVVTTANLWVLDYQPGDIVPSDGSLPFDKLQLIPKRWVHYNYPLHQLRLDFEAEKRGTFVVHIDAFMEFFNRVNTEYCRYINWSN